ncbi:MAG TPA: hypothetical protein VER79_06655 [Candidatus Limnocylindrales bacterium]|nr:hypothetical protein [Candidatus Limnocylindrales bacterium]
MSVPFIPEDGSDVFDDRLKELHTQCPDCGTLIYGSGRMVWNALTKRWFVDYWCPIDKQTVPKWTEGAQSTIRAVAASNGY